MQGPENVKFTLGGFYSFITPFPATRGLKMNATIALQRN
jgi:hypothetical protein